MAVPDDLGGFTICWGPSAPVCGAYRSAQGTVAVVQRSSMCSISRCSPVRSGCTNWICSPVNVVLRPRPVVEEDHAHIVGRIHRRLIVPVRPHDRGGPVADVGGHPGRHVRSGADQVLEQHHAAVRHAAEGVLADVGARLPIAHRTVVGDRHREGRRTFRPDEGRALSVTHHLLDRPSTDLEEPAVLLAGREVDDPEPLAVACLRPRRRPTSGRPSVTQSPHTYAPVSGTSHSSRWSSPSKSNAQ